ncbi:hypothetical protein GWI33_011955 [Rhynchophorus ferrugineus]|uniref:Uncharacterized protein n=1 Tax=Rhynchophorus ferrugineus TaxID=354439 RepID=A0A834MN53_RHYFE|nr:hypothetical protein GWI33_011955 [Rhynchophorus ferrugineus]
MCKHEKSHLKRFLFRSYSLQSSAILLIPDAARGRKRWRWCPFAESGPREVGSTAKVPWIYPGSGTGRELGMKSGPFRFRTMRAWGRSFHWTSTVEELAFVVDW